MKTTNKPNDNHKDIDRKQSDADQAYKTSSYCVSAECVAVGSTVSGHICIKDTKSPTQEVLTFTPDEWDAFVKGIKNGDFDQL